MSFLRLIILSVPLGACVASEPVGGTPGESSTDSSGEVEETHVVIGSDCGFELVCDPFKVVLDYHPPEARECAEARWAAGETGLVQVTYEPDGSDGSYADKEEFFVLLADRHVIRQQRWRDCDACDASSPWEPWGPHELCEISGGFYPDSLYDDCEPVADYSCEALTELLAEEPAELFPCEQRTFETCDGPLDEEVQCQWREDVIRYFGTNDICELEAPGACVGGRPAGLECELNPTCAGAGTEGVFYRENEDGTVHTYAGDGCWAPEGFERCSWGEPGSDDPPGMLEVGPAVCDCACG